MKKTTCPALEVSTKRSKDRSVVGRLGHAEKPAARVTRQAQDADMGFRHQLITKAAARKSALSSLAPTHLPSLFHDRSTGCRTQQPSGGLP